MADAGVRSINLTNRTALADEFLVNRSNSTALQHVSDLAVQLAGSGAVSESIAAAAVAQNGRISTLEQNQTVGKIIAASWPELASLPGTVARQGAEVLDADGGSHTDPVVGGTVPNAGSFQWSTSPAGWRRIGATGLSTKANQAALDGVDGVEGYITSQPNLFPNTANDFTVDPFSAHTTLLVATSLAGVPCWRGGASGAVPGSFVFSKPASSFPSGYLSFSARVLRMEAASVDATGTDGRILIFQKDSGGTEIISARSELIITTPTSGSLTTPTTLRLAGKALDAACATVEVSVRFGNINGSGTRYLYFRDLMLADGANPAFRLQSVTTNGLRADQQSTVTQTVAGLSSSVAVTPVSFQGAIKDRAGWAWTGNDFLDPTFASAGATVLWSAAVPVVTKNGRRCLETPLSATAVNRRSAAVDVSGYKSKRLSASFVVEEKTGNQGTANFLRVRLIAATKANPGTPLVWPDVSLSDNAAGVTNEFNKNLPLTDITTPTTLIIGENIQLPATAELVYFDIRVQTTAAQAYLTKFVMREGGDASFKDGSGGFAKYVTLGTGGQYATPDAALDALGGDGFILLKNSTTYGTEMRINPAKVNGRVFVVGEFASGRYPLIRLGTKAASIAKTSGQTQIYQFAVTGLTSTPNWIWLDGVNDTTTAINVIDRRPHHGGRSYRLPSTRIKKTTATTLAAAMTEMDASSAPLCFYDSGVMYVSNGGADLTAAAIYIDDAVSLVAAGNLGSRGELVLDGVEVRYGGINLRPFRRSGLRNVSSIGARANVIDYVNLEAVFAEAAAGGSMVTDLGDGFNGHDYALLTGRSIWSHDNQDDGESCHENGRVRIDDSLFESNGGTAVAPAYGCDAVYTNCESNSNQRISGRKPGAFAVVGGPGDGGNPNDGGIDTNAIFINCISRNDVVSFYDSSQTSATRAVCIGCKSINAATTAFDVYKIMDCSKIGSATAKTAKVIVENSTLVA